MEVSLRLLFVALLFVFATAEETVISCSDASLLVVKDNTCTCSEAVQSAQNQTTINAQFEQNVAIAFALVCGAGLSTTIGAAMVFCQWCVRQERFLFLGASLAFSGGVMMYVSLVEIFQKSIVAFDECNNVAENPCLWKDDGSGSAAYTMATVCVFSGVLFTLLLDLVVTCLSRLGGSHGHSHNLHDENCPSDTCEPVETGTTTSKDSQDNRDAEALQDIPLESARNSESVAKVEPIVGAKLDSRHDDKKKLKHMGLMTALAIGLHNFPEGLATFVATLADPAVGASLAIAIAIHNIPEGLCVAIPLYYSTGSRCKGFWFAFMSGITEIIGAALGYLILKNVLGPAAYGVLFGLVCGMMVTITVKELLPTAHRYDPEDRLVTKSFFFGAFVMALSLVLFVI